jgi:hypothetical protein
MRSFILAFVGFLVLFPFASAQGTFGSFQQGLEAGRKQREEQEQLRQRQEDQQRQEEWARQERLRLQAEHDRAVRRQAEQDKRLLDEATRKEQQAAVQADLRKAVGALIAKGDCSGGRNLALEAGDFELAKDALEACAASQR